MAGAYHDRDGIIWLDGAFVPWREAKVHVLTHALHYASSVFEGERAYGGEIFKSRAHSERLLNSCDLLDMPRPYDVDAIEAAKAETLRRSGIQDAYVRALIWRGSGEDMGVSSQRNPIHMAIAVWEWAPTMATPRPEGRSSTSRGGSGRVRRRSLARRRQPGST